MKTKQQIIVLLEEIVSEMTGEDISVDVNLPELSHGDYSTNVAMVLSKRLKKSPMEIAEGIAGALSAERRAQMGIEKIDVVNPGFINFWLKKGTLSDSLKQFSSSVIEQSDLNGRRFLVEYAHPNTHKEMHIGHMRTLITGEAVSRLLSANGAEVFRANYQGDIGPHVAKAIYGIQQIMEEKGLELSEVESWSHEQKAHFLGEGYVRGNVDYEAEKEKIDGINSSLYQMLEGVKETKEPNGTEVSKVPPLRQDSAGQANGTGERDLWKLYQITRQWSLDYYHDFYERFYTRFDRLFFESEMVGPGKKIVEENIGSVFSEDNGAIIFPGEKYGLHTRVFITQAGNPTYEGKEMGNGFAEENAFPFDTKIHVVGSEQAGYFQVVFKALELIDPEKFKDKQHHISMGMVNVVGMKMSSRTGEILRVDELVDTIKKRIEAMVDEGRIKSGDTESVTEMVAIGAIKYSVLKVGTGQNVAFDIEKSVSLEGDSGPYLQYTYARTQSVLAKGRALSEESKGQGAESRVRSEDNDDTNTTHYALRSTLEKEESDLLRFMFRFEHMVRESGTKYSPNILCDYLFDLARLYNLFYQKHKIIGTEQEVSRLALTSATGDILKSGLDLLGIMAPERM